LSIRLDEEWRLVESYLTLEKMRFEERLGIVAQIDEDTRSCEVPSMLLLTLAENAIKHGIARQRRGGTLSFRAELVRTGPSTWLRLRVTNPGQLSPGLSPTPGHGLANVRDQLWHLYGSARAARPGQWSRRHSRCRTHHPRQP
jgi:LytS/YehU family sensor histidine kinase